MAAPASTPMLLELSSALGDIGKSALVPSRSPSPSTATPRSSCPSPRSSAAGDRVGADGLGADAPERLQLPSVGSWFHCTGSCRPCSWFLKPAGCKNGKECLHCHLCTSDDLLARKAPRKQARFLRKAAAAAPASAPAPAALDSVAPPPPFRPPPGLPAPGQACVLEDSSVPTVPEAFFPAEVRKQAKEILAELPSVGSMLHATGACKPCAFFNSARGCAKGHACRYCHFCEHEECKMQRLLERACMRSADLVAKPACSASAEKVQRNKRVQRQPKTISTTVGSDCSGTSGSGGFLVLSQLI